MDIKNKELKGGDPARKAIAFIDNTFVWLIIGTIISIFQIAVVVNMNTALYMLVGLGLIVVIRATAKEYLSTENKKTKYTRLTATIFLSVLLKTISIFVLYFWMDWMVNGKNEISYTPDKIPEYLVPDNVPNPPHICIFRQRS